MSTMESMHDHTELREIIGNGGEMILVSLAQIRLADWQYPSWPPHSGKVSFNPDLNLFQSR
jgi:hypothetical protein